MRVTPHGWILEVGVNADYIYAYCYTYYDFAQISINVLKWF